LILNSPSSAGLKRPDRLTLLTSTVLFRVAVAVVLPAAAMFSSTVAARADGGEGGEFLAGTPGGAGGTGFTGNPGGAVPDGGGGGGGAGGGAGGLADGGLGGGGGQGGTVGSPNGQPGGDSANFDGGGGGGGFNGNGAGAATVANGGSLRGGDGGRGGNAEVGGNGAGGGGGAGGYGAVVTGTGGSSNASSIVGGNGGAGGGANALSSVVQAGNGGDGGIGVFFNQSGANFNNSGTVTGGTGGAAGVGTGRASNGTGGVGGAGVVGSGLTVINSGTITAGVANNGAGAQADAITFTGGANFLTLSFGGTTGTLNGGIGISGSLNVDPGTAAGTSVTLSNVIHDSTNGAGALTKIGAGTLTLSGTNAYTGVTTINGGVLEIDGSIAPSSMTTANANATLTGVGTVGNTTIAGGGIFAPGSGTPGSSMMVAGSLALQSGAMYVVMLNPTTASFANVTGTATLGGAIVNAFYANGSYISKQYAILTAGSVSGTFGSLVNSNLPANFTTSLSYDPTHAFLNLTLGFTGPNFGGGLNINQQNVANALTNFFNTTGGIPAVFGTLTPFGLTQASGESATGSQQATFDAMNLFMGVLSDPFVAGRGDGASTGTTTPGSAAEEGYGVSAYAPKDTPRSQSERDAYAAIYHEAPPIADPFTQRWSVWAAGYGGSQTPTAMPRSAPIPRPRASPAPWSAPIIVSRRLRLRALHWPAVAPVSASRVAAPGIPTCSRPARLSGTRLVKPISPAPSLMAGRTSPPIAR
jgi:hypothetical protein